MKRETKILKADHNPIKVGDNVLVDAKTKTKKRRKPTPEMGNNGNKPPRPPAWFQAFEERNNSRFDKIEARLGNLESNVQTINTRLDNLVKVNNLKE